MGTRTELEQLRARIAETPSDGRGHRQYGDALKRDVRRYARRRVRAEKVALNVVGAEIGISEKTLWGWVHNEESSGERTRERSLPTGAREFRAALAALGPRGRTTTYPPELRALAVAYLKERRGEGASFRAIASELGIGDDSLRSWTRPRKRRSPSVRRVSIAPSTPAPTATSMVVHGPAGLRIEGVDVSTIAALLRELS